MAEDKKKSTHRILVIDDNTSIHDDFRKILGKPISPGNHLEEIELEIFGSDAGATISTEFEIDCASQGEEGLEMVRRANIEGRSYSVAFVDGRMPPGWDGIETINHLWKECPDLQAVLCTAYADYSWQEIRRVLGENDSLLILKKPFDNIEVLQLAHTLTRKWELNREVQNRIENLDDLVRLRTEEKNRASALLEAALKNSPAGIVISNRDGNEILWYNPAAVEILGETPPPPLTIVDSNRYATYRALNEDGTPYDRENLPLAQAVLKGTSVRNNEFLLETPHGGIKWTSNNAAPIRDDAGNIIAGIIVFHDITERKLVEQEQEKLQAQLAQIQKMDSVGRLAGGIAHDFNNTMAVILGHVELGLLETDPEDTIHTTLADIKMAVQRSSDLTQQLLAFARKQAVAPKVLDLNRKVSDMLNMIHRLIGEDIDLFWNPGKNLWPVKMDPSQIDQILINLCVNARDAIASVGTLTIKTENIVFDNDDASENSEIQAGEYTMISVIDNGRGIEEKLLSSIFEPFFTTKEVGKGTGLGLATVYGIVKQNEGFLQVNSEPGKGTAFSVYLHRCEEELTEATGEKQEVKRGGQGEKVLVVEDNEDIIDITKSILERLGYCVLIAHSADKALQLAESGNEEIELLITDVVMPKMNGRDLAVKMQSLYPNLKCLFMSGYTADIITERGILDEGVHFLKKPFSITSLSQKVREALDDE